MSLYPLRIPLAGDSFLVLPRYRPQVVPAPDMFGEPPLSVVWAFGPRTLSVLPSVASLTLWHAFGLCFDVGSPRFLYSGACRGVDRSFETGANCIPACTVRRFPANWNLGRHAGARRSAEIAGLCARSSSLCLAVCPFVAGCRELVAQVDFDSAYLSAVGRGSALSLSLARALSLRVAFLFVGASDTAKEETPC